MRNLDLKDQPCLLDAPSNYCLNCKWLSVVVHGDIVHIECKASGKYLRDYEKVDDGTYEEF